MAMMFFRIDIFVLRSIDPGVAGVSSLLDSTCYYHQFLVERESPSACEGTGTVIASDKYAERAITDLIGCVYISAIGLLLARGSFMTNHKPSALVKGLPYLLTFLVGYISIRLI
uniref:Uncharacterized protein n=1 Tax=Anopheles darlingi TaxID=43151 RepID=A0A2M4DBW3_ANODA